MEREREKKTNCNYKKINNKQRIYHMFIFSMEKKENKLVQIYEKLAMRYLPMMIFK